MTRDQQHEIRNALVCLRHAIRTKNWTIVEEQVRRIDIATRPREPNPVRRLLAELGKIKDETDIDKIHNGLDALIIAMRCIL